MNALLELLTPYDIDGFSKIRLGGNNDGGYVIANELIGKIDNIVSSEDSSDISFEYDFMLLNHNCKLTNYDARTRNRIVDRRIRFIAGTIDESNPIAAIIHGMDNVLLKLDIEGKEYDAFRVPVNQMPDLSNVAMLVMELHGVGSNRYTQTIAMLSNLSKQMTLFHVHGNAWGGYKEVDGYEVPNVLEVTFIHNKYVTRKTRTLSKYPVVGLDECNRRGAEDKPLTFIDAVREAEATENGTAK